MIDFLNSISQVGYPIAVSGYTLIYIRASIDANTKALNDVSVILQKCKKRAV